MTTNAEDYMVNLCAFFKTQDYIQNIGIEKLREAHTRDELGITSLAVIMLVVNYMEASKVTNLEFNPDWVSKLDAVQGIISVFREIDFEKTRAQQPQDHYKSKEGLQ